MVGGTTSDTAVVDQRVGEQVSDRAIIVERIMASLVVNGARTAGRTGRVRRGSPSGGDWQWRWWRRHDGGIIPMRWALVE